MENIANEMIRFRAKNRMSQTEFAKRCGITPQTVCSVETGQQKPSRITTEKIRLVIEGGEAE